MLQAIFSAKEHLVISYGHLSKEDGKSVSPSLLVQELATYVGLAAESPQPRNLPKQKAISLSLPTQASLTKKRLLTVRELTRFLASPIRRYLEEIIGLDFPEEDEDPWAEFAFSPLDEQRALKNNPQFPPGLFGQEAALRLQAKQDALRQWGFEPECLELTETGMWPPLEVGGTKIVGEIAWHAPEGVVHLGDDSIEGIARKWPELLSALVFRGAKRIHCVKNGRVREVTDPLSALEGVVELFLHYQHGVLKFHPEWADAILRKNKAPDTTPNDRILQWAIEREPELYTPQEMLTRCLAPLAALFPTRGAHADV
jgi:hypothetical protein